MCASKILTSLQSHDVDFWVRLDFAVLAVLDTSVKEVVLRADPGERVTRPSGGLVAQLVQTFPFV